MPGAVCFFPMIHSKEFIEHLLWGQGAYSRETQQTKISIFLSLSSGEGRERINKVNK